MEVNNVNSAGAGVLTISGLGASVQDLGVQDVNIAGSGTTFAYASTAGTQSVDLTVNNVTNAHTVTVAGIEDVTVNSIGAQDNSIGLDANAATAITINADVALTLTTDTAADATVNVSLFDAFNSTDDVTLTVINQTGVSSATAVSIVSGAGDDTINVVLQAQSNVVIDGGAGDDSFVFGTAAGASSLATGDTVVGGEGADELVSTSATLDSTNTYTNISGIEQVTVADALVGDIVLSQIQAGISAVQLDGVANGRTITFDSGVAGEVGLNAALTAASTLTVASAGTAGTDEVAVVNILASATNAFNGNSLTATGVESLTVVTGLDGALAATQTIGTIGVTGSTGFTTAEAVYFEGTQRVQVGAITADIIDASGMNVPTGTVFNMTAAAAGSASIVGSAGNDVLVGAAAAASTVDGGAGNDTITGGSANDVLRGGAGADSITAAAGIDSIDGGADADRIVFATAGDLTTSDTVDGGAGANTLVVTAADLTTNANLATNINLSALGRVSNIQTVEVTGVGAGASTSKIDVSKVSSGITTVNTVAATGNTAATFTFNTGSSTLNLGGAMGAADPLTVAGSGTADSLTVVKNYAADEDALNFGTVTGVETLNINTGTTRVATTQATGSFTLTATGTNPNATINASGATALTLGAVTTGGSGLLTIDGSGMTAQATGTTFTVTAPVTTSGTVSITGSAGNDALTGDANDSNTINGGAGIDTITGGTAADNLNGGAGNDIIYAGGGNDVLNGDAGNDSIVLGTAIGTYVAGTVTVNGGEGNDTVYVGNTLTTGDLIDGGAGVNILSESTALLGAYAGVTNFQTLQLQVAGITQDMSKFTGTTFDTLNVIATGTGTGAVTNASASLNSLYAADAATTVTFSRATDTSADALTVGAVSDTTGVTFDVVANNEETLNFVAGTTAALSANTIGFTSADVTNVNISGIANQAITLTSASTGARGITVDASTNTGTVTFVGTAATADQALTITGSTTATNLLTGGAAADTITAGTGTDVIVGGLLGDTMNVGSGTDAIYYTAVNQSTTVASAATGQVYTNIDLIYGAGAGDTIQFLAAAVTAGGAYTSVGAVAANNVFVNATVGALADNSAAVIRGDYDTLTGVWTASLTGHDTLVAYDQNSATAGQSYVGAILVGVNADLGGAVTFGAGALGGTNVIIAL